MSEASTARTRSALALARQHPGELAHAQHVTRLAARLFDALTRLHRLGPREKELLCCAALLHDTGISVDFTAHHKHSLRLIMRSDLPAFTAREKAVVANLARYHRKAEPSPAHAAFAALDTPDRRLVAELAALLRIADGLDRAHANAVASIAAPVCSASACELHIAGPGDLRYAAESALRKAGLFESVFRVKLRIRPRATSV